ncbi:DJ-1/PfpI family protein [Marinicella sp. S1101]|uniref:DJ-1/PfpI family protein n=1 Tax=Marinicella marina TaxID=2996016 RepID=UPI002260DCA1|nr:DJ-1/PfpI family protein [Marinicella marina]MCX7554694.1 DJ-1/PfpI family protein [Marinicella marina]MDJ1141490.1 DJ-1/PfpI family protein [Marinicella marina]
MTCTCRKNKSLSIWLAALWVVIISPSFQAAAEPAKAQLDPNKPKVLMVLSGYGENQGETQPGFEFDELSKAYLTFRDNGVAVDIASPQGGAVEADQYDAKKDYNQTFMADQKAMNQLADTLALKEVNSQEYAAVFVVGGKGAMFDLPYDTNLQQIIASVYQSGGSVGAVCHGPAALVDVQLDDGSYLVAGKKVNGFTNEEEKTFGKKWVKHFDFLLEDKLKERKAQFQSSPMMLSHVAIDQRLVTGQNPASTVDTAQAMLVSMGITPNGGNQYSDDLTLKLVAEILKGNEQAIKTYRDNTDSYQPMIMGMYGYMYFTAAASDVEYQQALTLMQLAQKDMNHPKLDLQIAKAHLKLQQTAEAKSLLTDLVANNPDLTEAQTLMEQL